MGEFDLTVNLEFRNRRRRVVRDCCRCRCNKFSRKTPPSPLVGRRRAGSILVPSPCRTGMETRSDRRRHRDGSWRRLSGVETAGTPGLRAAIGRRRPVLRRRPIYLVSSSFSWASVALSRPTGRRKAPAESHGVSRREHRRTAPFYPRSRSLCAKCRTTRAGPRGLRPRRRVREVRGCWCCVWQGPGGPRAPRAPCTWNGTRTTCYFWEYLVRFYLFSSGR